MSEHEHSLMPYFWVLMGLFALTGVTVGVALIDFGHPWSDIVALVIALAKATLVVMFFMHVKGSSRLIKVTAFSGFFWVFLLFAYLIGDVVTREGETVFEGWQPDVRKELSAAAGKLKKGYGEEDHAEESGEH